MSNHLSTWLAHPLTRGLPIDDPRTTERRRRIIASNRFLRRLYEEWYARLAADVPIGEGRVLELGSGAGFCRSVFPDLITSEWLACAGIDVRLDGTRLPFAQGSLRGIVMTDVLHHLPDVAAFFREAARSVRRQGVVTMIEPWVTPWSRMVYGRLHHESFEPDARDWTVPATGPLSGANGALPWIVFVRDRSRFEQQFPEWRVRGIELLMPFRYLVSGGVSLRPLMPGWSTPAWRALEALLRPWMGSLAMFAHVTLERTGEP